MPRNAMSRNARDTPPQTDFFAWPRPIPTQYVPFLRIAVLLVLVTVLLVTVLPSLPFLHFLINALFVGALARRLTRSRPRQAESEE